MINVFRSSGFDLSIRATPGAIEVEFPIGLTDTAIQHFEDRETQAAISAMRTFLAPRSIAVVGASRDSSAIGGRLFHNLLMTEFSGAVFPVNPKANVVHGVVAYPNVEAIPGDVDVAFVAVPAIHLEEIAEQCGRKGVRGLVVISAGFAEIGDEGVQRQARLLETCRSYGMRLIGPNCMGIVNTAEDVRLNGTFANVYPPAGRVGFSSQSGALGLAVMQYAAELGLGLSSFVSVGNKADISGNDLVAYWSVDERTDVILLYLESFGNPRRFARLAREIGRSKPIIAVKSGRSAAGQRAAASHTGALLATSDVTVDALFRQAGVIRTDTLEEMFDVATILGESTTAEGRRRGDRHQCGRPRDPVRRRVRGPRAACRGALGAEHGGPAIVPVRRGQRGESRGHDRLRDGLGLSSTIEIVAADPGVDAMIVIYIPPETTRAEEIGEAIAEGSTRSRGESPWPRPGCPRRGSRRSFRRPGPASLRSRSRSRQRSRWPARRRTADGARGRWGPCTRSTMPGRTRRTRSSRQRSAAETTDG